MHSNDKPCTRCGGSGEYLFYDEETGTQFLDCTFCASAYMSLGEAPKPIPVLEWVRKNKKLIDRLARKHGL